MNDHFASGQLGTGINGILPPIPTPLLVANDDSAVTNEDTAAVIHVMNNDSYIGLGHPAVTSVTQPSHGNAVINADNTIRYNPHQNFFGSDSFRYTLSDGLLSDTAIVSVSVASVNDNPSATDDFATIDEDNSVAVDVLANDSDVDGDSLTILSVGSGNNGSTAIQNGAIVYTPDADFYGQDSFSYTVSDGHGGQDTAIVSVSVASVNDNPSATDDFATIDEDNSVAVDVLANDSDVDGDSLTILSVGSGNNGSTAIQNGAIVYTPDADFYGQDSFSYTVSDGHGGQDTATISVTVNPVADVSITKTQSGLVMFDPLNNETKTRQELEANQSYWHYGGSAFSYFNPPAPTDLFKDSQGLHLGVKTPVNGTYAGYYAVAPLTSATLFHATISTPVRTISGDFFQNGLYVQTGDGRINYVTCVSITSTAGTSWHIVRTFGNFDQATQFEVLWSDTSQNQPLSRDCTIITNGDNYLKVYLDGVNVYTNNTLNMQMPGPFLYFLEPQNSHSEMLYGIYNDYYTAKGETIRVTDDSSIASRVDVVGASGNVLATAPVSDGVATLDVGMYHFPLAANIKVYGSNNAEIVSSNVSIFGGDVYAITQ